MSIQLDLKEIERRANYAAFQDGLMEIALGLFLIVFGGALMTIIAIAVIGLLAHLANRYIYLDVALVYGLLSFLGVLAVARFLEKGI